jgi:predicted glycoside hydrolase/deacetylase ChbG (UPF0249 family)
MKRPLLIVNADDYAMNESMSSSIRAAFSEGLISSSTCFATSPIFEDEICKAFEVGIKTFGVHLDLSFGVPVSQAIGHNKFPENSAQLLTKEQIKSEFSAQIQKVLDFGVQISHLDNHREELYWEWEKFEAVYEIAAKFSLPVRNPLGKNTSELAQKLYHVEEKVKKIESLSLIHEKLREKHGIRTTDYFYSLEHYREDPVEKIKGIIETLESQNMSIELCVHLTHQIIAAQSEKQFISENDNFRKLFIKYSGTFADV